MPKFVKEKIDFDNLTASEDFEDETQENWKSFTGWSFIEHSLHSLNN